VDHPLSAPAAAVWVGRFAIGYLSARPATGGRRPSRPARQESQPNGRDRERKCEPRLMAKQKSHAPDKPNPRRSRRGRTQSSPAATAPRPSRPRGKAPVPPPCPTTSRTPRRPRLPVQRGARRGPRPRPTAPRRPLNLGKGRTDEPLRRCASTLTCPSRRRRVDPLSPRSLCFFPVVLEIDARQQPRHRQIRDIRRNVTYRPARARLQDLLIDEAPQLPRSRQRP